MESLLRLGEISQCRMQILGIIVVGIIKNSDRDQDKRDLGHGTTGIYLPSNLFPHYLSSCKRQFEWVMSSCKHLGGLLSCATNGGNAEGNFDQI